MLVRFEQRIHLAAVVPAADFADEQLLPLVHHVLERVREIELAAFAGGTLQHVFDASNSVRQSFTYCRPMLARFEIGVLAFSTILRHVALLVGHDDAEALIVLDLFGPDDAVGPWSSFTIDRSASNSVSTKITITGPSTYGRARFTAPAVPSSTFCSMKRRGNVVVLPHVRFDFLLQMPRDDDQLVELPGAAQRIHDVIHHGPACDIHKWLGERAW